jgi:hypothetical protein
MAKSAATRTMRPRLIPSTRAPMAIPQGPNQRWSLDFLSDAFCRRPSLPHSGRRRRLHPRMPGAGRRHFAAGPAGRARARTRHCSSGAAGDVRLRQRHRVDRPALEPGDADRVALHCARRADTKRHHRELQRPASRRTAQRDAVHHACPGTRLPSDRTACSAICHPSNMPIAVPTDRNGAGRCATPGAPRPAPLLHRALWAQMSSELSPSG